MATSTVGVKRTTHSDSASAVQNKDAAKDTEQVKLKEKRKPKTKAKTVKEGTIGLLEYKVHDVRGDGSCFYRAMYQILRESGAGQQELGLDKLDLDSASSRESSASNASSESSAMTEDEKLENRGVKKIRGYIGNLLRRTWDQDAIETVDNLCNLVIEAGEEDSEQLYEDLNEMYPFVTEDVCVQKGKSRYQKVADLIEDMDDLMYASSLEIDIIKRMLESVANLSVIVISYTGKRREKVEEKWKSDILGLLQNSTKKDVCILLNKNNIHYQYLIFKGPMDETYHTIMDRGRLIQLLQDKNNVFSKMLSSLTILGGANKKQQLRKKKTLQRMYSVASASTLAIKAK